METSSFSSDGRTFCVLGGSRLIGCACPATAAPPTKPGMRHGTVWWLVKMNAAKRVSYGGTAVARSCCACPAAARSYDACPAVARSYNKSLPHDGCGRLHFTKWRRVRDSNSRYRFPRIHAFQACSFNHSDNSPNALHEMLCCFVRRAIHSARNRDYYKGRTHPCQAFFERRGCFPDPQRKASVERISRKWPTAV